MPRKPAIITSDHIENIGGRLPSRFGAAANALPQRPHAVAEAKFFNPQFLHFIEFTGHDLAKKGWRVEAHLIERLSTGICQHF
jgi:hypothetical protein